MATYTLGTLEVCHPPLQSLRLRIDALEGMPAFIAGVIAAASDAQLRHKPAPELFSIKEQICHLRDIEIGGYTLRLERIFHEHQPKLADIDGAQLAIERKYNEQAVGPAFMAFRAARQSNLIKLRSLSEADLARKAEMVGVGEVTLAQLIAMWAAHDAGHRRELELLLVACLT